MADNPNRTSASPASAKQRRLIRVAIVYAMVGFAVAQIGGLLLALSGFPDGSGSFLGLLVVTGFPVAMAIAWLYDPAPPARRPPAPSGPAPLPTPAPRAPRVPRALGSRAVGASTAPIDVSSLAVLPFADVSAARDQEWLGDGLAEEVLDTLSRVPGVHVTARESSFAFRGEALRTVEIGEALNVEAVLEGTVQESEGRLLVSAQLLDTRSGEPIWSESYERESRELYDVEREIAGAVARALKVAPADGRDPEPVGRSADPEAHLIAHRAAYLNARYTADDCTGALALYQEAIGRDPSFARGWAGIAETYVRLVHLEAMPARDALPQARTAAARALELEPNLPEVHMTLGDIAMIERGFDRADREYRRAIELNPLSAAARVRYSALLTAVARVDEAIEHARLAMELDPMSASTVYNFGIIYALHGRNRVALELLERARALAPENPQVDWALVGVLGDVGRRQEAVEVARELHAKLKSRWSAARLAAALSRAGAREEAGALARNFEGPRAQRVTPGKVHPQEIVADAWLGHNGDALRALDSAIERSEPFLAELATGMDFDPLRNDPRWEPLLSKAGFHDDVRRRARALYEQRLARAKGGA